jgi:hypothetical protein
VTRTQHSFCLSHRLYLGRSVRIPSAYMTGRLGSPTRNDSLGKEDWEPGRVSEAEVGTARLVLVSSMSSRAAPTRTCRRCDERCQGRTRNNRMPQATLRLLLSGPVGPG